MSIKTVFWGTDIYAAQLLELLLEKDIFDISLVITQPDTPVGRKKILTPPPVKKTALSHDIEILQPVHVRKEAESLVEILRHFDIGLVTRYGQIIPESTLETPRYGMVNVHPSVLPEYRGATPIQTALIDGKTETGVSIIQMDSGVDSGDVLGIEHVAIDPSDTYSTLSEKLTPVSANMLHELIPQRISGKLVPQEQDHAKATFCSQFSKDDGRIDWNKTATEIYNKYRGLLVWPGIWTTLNNKRLKLLNIEPSPVEIPTGKIVIDHDKLLIGTAEGSILVHELQPEGKTAMSAQAFIKGNTVSSLEVI